jgi:prophage antirepressor-like protein
MKNVQVLKQENLLGKNFSIFGDLENPLFLAKDVAAWIEHSNPTEMVRGIDDDEKLNSTILSSGQNRDVIFLTENGLYEVLMQSRKPIAKQFKKGVKEILKSIRKTGGYLAEKEGDTEMDLLSRALLIAMDKIKQRELRVSTLEEQDRLNQPKVEYHDKVLKCANTYTSTRIAKELGMTKAEELHLKLKEMGILFKQSGQWMLRAKFCGHGYSKSKTTTIPDRVNCVERTITYTVWTEKGRKFLHDIFQ